MKRRRIANRWRNLPVPVFRNKFILEEIDDAQRNQIQKWAVWVSAGLCLFCLFGVWFYPRVSIGFVFAGMGMTFFASKRRVDYLKDVEGYKNNPESRFPMKIVNLLGVVLEEIIFRLHLPLYLEPWTNSFIVSTFLFALSHIHRGDWTFPLRWTYFQRRNNGVDLVAIPRTLELFILHFLLGALFSLFPLPLGIAVHYFYNTYLLEYVPGSFYYCMGIESFISESSTMVPSQAADAELELEELEDTRDVVVGK